MTKQVRVAVGVVKKGDEYFICRRNAQQHQGDKWEFPGGKIESHESPEQALSRELNEEIGIQVNQCEPLTQIIHDYGDKQVCLFVFVVSSFSGQAHGKEGQLSAWVPSSELENYEFPDANQAILEKLLNS
ncbi:8-oxo-dGTP diphosphatase MutT [Glaciecola sp. 1036]|uniref:8-oxo-dGTP diphosphatase MutT n=1 Tax=Alteromonadaceae TaxID=72275 RepID=UPI003CFE498D